MAVLVGIDGTGSAFLPGEERDRRYDAAFANSFVRRLVNARNLNHRYFRGPVALGGGLVAAINEAFTFVMSSRQRMASPESVLLTGYSRGAAGVVCLAGKLKRAGVNVQAMLLFDCVDRHLFVDAEVVPNNVAHVMHVIRDPAGRSRRSFGNEGLKFSPPTVYPPPKKFMCTHGGMGGTPWALPKGSSPANFIKESFPDGETRVTYADDARVSQEVWSYVQPFIRTHGF